jgi:transposase
MAPSTVTVDPGGEAVASGSGPYSPEFKAEVVAAYMAGGKTYAQVAREFGKVSSETVRNWVTAEKKAQSGRTEEARAATQRARERELERRVRELEDENAFLKKVSAFFAKEFK